MEGCDDALSGGGGGGHDSQTRLWVRKTGEAARDALLWLVRACGGAAALEQLRTAAAHFKEVLRVLDTAAEGGAVLMADGQPITPASAASPVSAAPAAAAAAAAASAPSAPDIVATACAACGAANAALKCGGCLGARYCGADCQKRDWPAHKAACKQRRQQAVVKKEQSA